jgi:hypothetical protein
MSTQLRIVILGLSLPLRGVTATLQLIAAWLRELCARGHNVLFLERDVRGMPPTAI